ncbi:digeranylgeranylglycerophospholipid reductase [Planctomycetaceae bacterium]|nr:digeranylgeranylglycerophospholipid reductase [Planctomycetaceae bacterium]
MYDVIIVGAGPGGASAAYFLGEAGQRVLVLEKATLPRYKTCGGGLSTRMLEKYFSFSFDPVIESHMNSMSYALGDEHITVPLPHRSLCMVMRDRFDAHILAHAQVDVRQGVAVRSVMQQDDRVIVETADGDTFEGCYLIGADGANSIVARSLGLRRGKTLVAAIEAEVAVPPEVQARFADTPLFIFGEVHLGYLWIFPKADHLSVGIAALHPQPGELQVTLRRVMARYDVSLEGVALHGHPIPVYTHREKITTTRTLLVGDAAGLADPLSGEGIRMAIKSGRLAAETIRAGHPERYAGKVFWQIGLCHIMNMALAEIFYRRPQACFELGVRNPFASRALIDLLSDRISSSGVMLRLFGTLPVYLATEAIAALIGPLGGKQSQQRFRSRIYSMTAPRS